MLWQDILLMIGGFGFSLALLPSVLKRANLPLSTSGLTGVILTLYLPAYATLSLWLAFFSTILTACMWWYLFYLGVRKKK